MVSKPYRQQVVGTLSVDGGHPLYHYNPLAGLAALSNIGVAVGAPTANTPSPWDQIDGGATGIAVDANGAPWVINSYGQVYVRTPGKTGYVDGTWKTVSPAGTARGIGAGGPLF
jgi:hypothetical protein